MNFADNPSTVIEQKAANWFIERFVAGSPAKNFLYRLTSGAQIQNRIILRNARYNLTFRWNATTNSVLIIAMSPAADWAAGEISIQRLGKHEYFKFYPRINPSTDIISEAL